MVLTESELNLLAVPNKMVIPPETIVPADDTTEDGPGSESPPYLRDEEDGVDPIFPGEDPYAGPYGKGA